MTTIDDKRSEALAHATGASRSTTESQPDDSGRLPRVDTFIECLAIAAWLFTIASLRNASDLPDLIPAKFDTSGVPTAWRPASFIYVLRLLSTVFYAGLTWVSRYPQAYTYPVSISDLNRERQYALALRLLRLIKAETLILFAHIQHTTYNISLGTAAGIGAWHLPFSLFLIVGTVAIYLIAARKT